MPGKSSSSSDSPRWGSITKLTVSLTIIVILGAFIIHFRSLLGPVIFAFVVAYVLHPVVAFITRKTRLSWKLAVSLIYLIIIIILVGLLTLSGVGLIQQGQNMVRTIQQNIDRLPGIIEAISNWKFELGSFKLDFAAFDWKTIGEQVLGYVEPVLGEVGSLLGSLASGAAALVGWIIFIIIVSYFFLFESNGFRERIIQVNIPLYSDDVKRMGAKLSDIWNAFLRGQIIIFLLTSVVYAVFLSAMGTRYALLLALITGFANFIPYVGPAINWVVLGLVTYFQPTNIFGISPFSYMAIIIIVAVLIDQVFNNFINPRVMASALKVHPAFVLIAALLAADLIGVIGVILAAPLLATSILLGTYIVRKMLDRDPWPPEEEVLPKPPPILPAGIRKLLRRKDAGSEKDERKPKQGKSTKTSRKDGRKSRQGNPDG